MTGQAILQSVFRNVSVAQNLVSKLPGKMYWCFTTSTTLKYHAFCDDFGPMNMSSIIEFIEILDSELAAHPTLKIVYYVESGQRELTNAIFLLGSYMILKLSMNAEQVANAFCWLDQSMVESYRDATFSEPDFRLTLLDCWKGLERGRTNGWVRMPTKSPRIWGKINIDEYNQHDNPDNADLHEVVPDKLVAFKGPQDLGGSTFFDDREGYRHFSASHYLPIFDSLGVAAVIRLNEAEYDASEFEGYGIAHHDHEFQDCTAPPFRVVEAFFRIVDATPGTVAVHCRAGLGRTGTLIALYMMRSCGFTAREAIGWLRIMRPGSIIGDQQRYLVDIERCMLAFKCKQQANRHKLCPAAPLSYWCVSNPSTPLPAGVSLPRRVPTAAALGVAERRGGLEEADRSLATPTAASSKGKAAELAAQVALGMERRGAARSRGACCEAAGVGLDSASCLPFVKVADSVRRAGA